MSLTDEPFAGSVDLPVIAAQLDAAIRSSHARAVRRRRVCVRAMVLVVAVAAVALGAVGVVSRDAPSSAQPALAQVMRRAVAALEPGADTILHVAMSATESGPDGATASWTDESWGQYAAGSGSATQAFRQVITRPGGPDPETAIVGASGPVRSELYDPATDTVYDAAPTLPGGLPLPQPNPAAAPALGTSASPATGCVTGFGRAQLPAGAPPAFQAEDLAGDPYLGPAVIDSSMSTSVAAAPQPWSPEAATLLERALRDGCASVAGSATVDGHRAIEIRANGAGWTYDVDAETYAPLRLVIDGSGGLVVTFTFDTYEHLPVQGNGSLVSLTVQHPSAKIDSSTADYVAAQARLFPSDGPPSGVPAVAGRASRGHGPRGSAVGDQRHQNTRVGH